jgi:hypothetical protein
VLFSAYKHFDLSDEELDGVNKILAFVQNKKNYDQLDYDYPATMANLERYLGYPPTGGFGNAAQLKRRPVHKALRRQVAEAPTRPTVKPSKKNATDKGKDKANEPSKKPIVDKDKRKSTKVFRRIPMAAKTRSATTPLRLVNKREESPMKKKKSLSSDP